MIAASWTWRAAAIDPMRIRQFTAALETGTGKTSAHQSCEGLLLTQLCRNRSAAQRWSAAAVGDGRMVLFHGTIDNRAELTRALEVRTDDADLYAAGLRRWDRAVDNRVIGAYAAIVADPERRTLVAVRSPINAPPLHFWHDGERSTVASIARVLFATGDLEARVDEQKIADSLYLNYADAERGWFRDVRRVATGCRVTITPDGHAVDRFHDLRRLPRVRLPRDRDYVTAADELLRAGVAAATRDAGMPAVSLSGGYDSQAVAAYAAGGAGRERPLLGLTGVPEPGWSDDGSPPRLVDESPHAAALAAMYPALRVERVDAAGASFDRYLDPMFLFGGAPPRNVMNLHWIHALRERARRLGADVVLLGGMGNWSFSFDGLGALPGWLAGGRWRRLAREIAAARRGRSWLRTFAGDALRPLVPPLRSGASERLLDPWHALNPDYALRMRVRERAADHQADMSRRLIRSTRNYRAAVISNARNELGDVQQALELIHGIPARDPTAYRPLVEFCMGIPDDQFLRDGTPRWLARRLLAGRVPDIVLNERRRGQQGADWPLRLGREKAELLAELERLARDPAMAARIDVPTLLRTVRAWNPGLTPDVDTAAVLQLALPRALATARFIRWVDGGNH